MADKGEMIGNFGIEETLNMGAGNPELLRDLMATETSTADVDELEEIGKKVDDDDITEKPDVTKKKVVTSSEDDISGDELIDQFLTTSEEEEEEEEIEKKKPEGKPETTNDEVDDIPEGVNFSALAKDLTNLGVFTKDEDEDEVEIATAEEFLERFNTEKKKGAAEWLDGFLGQFGEDRKQAFNAIFVNGADPKEYFSVYNEITDFANIDLKDENNQKRVVKESLRDQGWEEEDIDEEVDRLYNIGDLEKVAEKHQKVLVKRDAKRLKEIEENSKKELEQRAAIKEQYIQNVQRILQEKIKTKEFDGIPISAKFANELQDFLLVDKWKTVRGETLTDFDRAILELKKPENHEMKVKVAALYKMLEKDPTLSTLQKTTISKKSNQLFDEIAKQTGKKRNDSVKTTSYFKNL